ncbi:MAG: GAF domain-containing protein [Elusimicrobiota bacterium]
MRSIIRDFTGEYFRILSWPKEKWPKFWDKYTGDHPRVFEEYRMKNCLNPDREKEILLSTERRYLDRVYQKWSQIGIEKKHEAVDQLKKKVEDLELNKEDFVIQILGGLGLTKKLFISTSKGFVVFIDLVAYYNEEKLEDIDDFVRKSAFEFRKYSRICVTREMDNEKRSKRFDKLIRMLEEKLEGKAFDERLRLTVDFLDHYVDYYNWTGFYIAKNDNKLKLGSYLGEPTEHKLIDFGSGICGQAAERKENFIVGDVSKETNYLSCSSKTKSEIVIPLMKKNKVIGELDIDSHHVDIFTSVDEEFLEKICELILK